MKSCENVKDNLLSYLYDLLEPEETKEIKKHLKKCKNCREELKKLLKIRIILENTPYDEPKNQLEYILNKAKQIEQKRFFTNFYKLIFFSNLIKILKKNLKLKVLIVLLICIIFSIVGTLYFSFIKNSYLYVLKSYGNVKVNNKIIDFKSNVKYNLKDKINISILNGECILQIDNDKLILLKDNTHIILYSKKDININLTKGFLIGKVIKAKNKKSLIISSGNAVFKVIGTIFFVKKVENLTELGVKEGTVKSIFNNEEFFVTKNEKIKIRGNNIFLTKVLSKKEKGVLNIIKEYNLINRFDKTKKVYIKTSPKQCEVYFRNIYLGKSPLFFLTDERMNNYFLIKKEGFVGKEFALNKNEKDYVIDIALKKGAHFSINWKLKLKNKIFTNPFYIDNFIILSDSIGFIYKIDCQNKKILWKFKASRRIDSIPLYLNGILYITSNDGYLYAIDFEKGKLKWKVKVGTLVYSSPQYYNKNLYLCNNTGKIYCVNIKKGKILWNKKFAKGFFASPLIYNGNLYIGGLRGNFYSINLKSKKINWVFKTRNRIVGSNPLIKNNLIFFGSNDRYLYALDLETGNLKWKFLTNDAIFTSPLLMQNSVIITTIKGTVYSITIDNGSLNWKFDTRRKILITPYIIDNRYICVGTKDNIYILNKWGILYAKFKLLFNGFTVCDNKNLLLCGKDKYLYSLNLNFITGGEQK